LIIVLHCGSTAATVKLIYAGGTGMFACHANIMEQSACWHH